MLGAALRWRLGKMPVESRSNICQATNLFTLREMYFLRIFHYLLASATLEDEHFAEMPLDNLEDLINKS